MASQILPAAALNERAQSRRASPVLPWERLALLGVLLVSAFLSLFRLSQQGNGNEYYTAAVKSMLQSWHNFFFVSFDPGGFVSVDKPPLGLWIQAASAKLFGFGGFSVIMPQVVAGLLSVALLYHLVRRTWGPVAGLLAALTLTLSPISVVTSRTNNLDSLLVLTVLLAAWAVFRATETGRLRWLLLGFVLVGLGFNIKMLQAFLVLPAFGALYFLAARTSWRRRIAHLAAATVVLAMVSLAWAVAVDLTPTDARPYVGSSSSNSAIDLILGYNGLGRLTGEASPGGGGARPAGGAAQPQQMPTGTAGEQTSADDGAAQLPGASPQGAAPPTALQVGQNGSRPSGQGGFGGGPGGEGGEKGLLRLFNEQMAGQIGWLLPFALIGLAGAIWQVRPRLSLDRRAQSLVLWGLWFLTAAAFFSVAGFFHRYYLVMLAPAVAALCGIGAVALWQLYRRPGLGGWLLPAALLATAAVQAHILADYPDWRERLTPVVLGLGGALVLALIVARLWPGLRPLRGPGLALALGVPALLAAPAVWAGISVWEGTNTTLPTAGPPAGRFGGPGGGAGRPNGGSDRGSSEELLRYLEENRGDAKFLVATTSAGSAESIILETGEAVMAMGGFTGSDPILTTDELATLVQEGTVRFFLVGGPGMGGPALNADAPRVSDGAQDAQSQVQGSDQPQEGSAPSVMPDGSDAGGASLAGPMGGSGSLITWVTQNCTAVPAEQLGGASNQLYDCGSTGS